MTPNSKSRNIAKVSDRKRGKIQMTDLNFDFDSVREKAKAELEIVESTPFDADKSLESAKKHHSIVSTINQINEMKKEAIEVKIIDEASFNKAMEMSIQIKALIKSADDLKKEIPVYKEAQRLKNGIDKYVLSALKKPLESIDNIIRPKISFYSRTQAELERRKQQKLAEEAAKKAKEEAEKAAEEAKKKAEEEKEAAIKLQAKLNLEADEAGVDRVSVPIPPDIPEVQEKPVEIYQAPVTQKSEKVVADHGTAKIEGVWICIINNPDEVERKYCSPDQKKLDEAVESGIREIPGCKIEESFDPKIRLSKKRKEPDIRF